MLSHQGGMQLVAELAAGTRSGAAPHPGSARSLPSPRTLALDSTGGRAASAGTAHSTGSGSLAFHTVRDRGSADDLSPPASTNVYATIASQLSNAAMSTLSAAQPIDPYDE